MAGHLKGGNIIGIRMADGEMIRNEDGSPLTFLVEDPNGEIHELFMSIGRMGTFVLLTLPPFEIEQEAAPGETGEGTVDPTQGIPVAQVSKRVRQGSAKASN